MPSAPTCSTCYIRYIAIGYSSSHHQQTRCAVGHIGVFHSRLRAVHQLFASRAQFLQCMAATNIFPFLDAHLGSDPFVKEEYHSYLHMRFIRVFCFYTLWVGLRYFLLNEFYVFNCSDLNWLNWVCRFKCRFKSHFKVWILWVPGNAFTHSET